MHYPKTIKALWETRKIKVDMSHFYLRNTYCHSIDIHRKGNHSNNNAHIMPPIFLCMNNKTSKQPPYKRTNGKANLRPHKHS